MAEKRQNIMNLIGGFIITAVLGYTFISANKSKENQQDNIDNLPALKIEIESAQKEAAGALNGISILKKDTDKRFDLVQEQLDRRIERELQGQMDRRFEALQREIDIIRNQQEELQTKIEELIKKP